VFAATRAGQGKDSRTAAAQRGSCVEAGQGQEFMRRGRRGCRQRVWKSPCWFSRERRRPGGRVNGWWAVARAARVGTVGQSLRLARGTAGETMARKGLETKTETKTKTKTKTNPIHAPSRRERRYKYKSRGVGGMLCLSASGDRAGGAT
jgi:hypothetical protein